MSAIDEATGVFPKLVKYKKLIVALVGSTAPFVAFLVGEPHSQPEITNAALAYVLFNFGIYEAKNG